MPLLIDLILSLAFAAAAGGAVHVWRLQLEASRRAGMQALAARRGWALTVTGEGLGRPGTLRLVPRGGLPWMVESRPLDRAGGGPVTEYEAEEPRWPEATLLMIPTAPAQPAGEAAPAEAGRGGRELWGEEIARLAATLRPVPAPEGVTVLSDGNASLRVTVEDLAQVMKAFVPVASGPRGLPVLILSPEGLRLRLRRPIKRPDQMERFLDLALDLSRLIGP